METINLGKYVVKVLDPKILVFQDVFPFADKIIDYYESNVEWQGWYGFGTLSSPENPTTGYTCHTEKFPTKEEWDAALDKNAINPYRNQIHEEFYNISSLYVDYTQTTLPNWMYQNDWCLAKYTPDVDHSNNPETSMGHHTDYQQDRHGQPGNKFGITSVFYPNDDYEGGEIQFRILNPGTFTVAKQITYKPKRGELVIFPSGDPYYHGVKRIWKNPKYIIRLYWGWQDQGLPEWHALRKHYGNEKFEELEKQRLKRDDLLMFDPVQKPLLTFDRYYDLMEKGLLPERGNPEAADELRKKVVNSDGKIYE